MLNRLPQYASLCCPPLSKQQNKVWFGLQPIAEKCWQTFVVSSLPSWLGPLSPESKQNFNPAIYLLPDSILLLKSSLFHQKLELIHIEVGNTVGLVQVAQQLISPPKLLPPIAQGPCILPLSQSVSKTGISSFSIKSKYLSPLPPNLYPQSYEQVYQLFLSFVFHIPTTMIYLILPYDVSRFIVFWMSQAVPNAAWLLLNRFWPSCINRTSYFLKGFSKYEGGQQMLHLRVLFKIFETTLVLSTILLAAGLKLGQISTFLSPPLNTLLTPNIQLLSPSKALTLIVTFSGQRKAACH